jgi:hypothetical protein
VIDSKVQATVYTLQFGIQQVIKRRRERGLLPRNLDGLLGRCATRILGVRAFQYTALLQLLAGRAGSHRLGKLVLVTSISRA